MESRPHRVVAAAVVAGGVFLVLNAGYVAIETRYALRGAEPTGHAASEPVPMSSTADIPAPQALGPDELRIASVGIRVPVVYAPVKDETQFQEALQRGVVHYPKTAEPGEPGNAYVFGHSSDFLWRHNPYAHAFTLLPHVAAGDVIELSDHAGRTFLYEVTETFIVSPTDTRVLDQGDGSASLITLQTSYPFGTALARFIVRGRLVIESKQPRF